MIVFLVPILKAFDKREDAFYEQQLFLEICGRQQAGCVVASLFCHISPNLSILAKVGKVEK